MSSNIKAALKNIKPKVASKSGITQRVAQMMNEMNQFDTMGAADMMDGLDELETNNSINFTNPNSSYGSPNISKYALPKEDNSIQIDDNHTIHTFKIDIKTPKGDMFPKSDVMKAVGDAVEGLGNMEVMGFSYQKADKEGSKKS
jgi:hypothetical protein